MTNEHDRNDRRTEVRPEAEESDFARVERAGAEAMARRPNVVDEEGRRVTDPGQEMRSPEERPSIEQATRAVPPEQGEDARGAAR